MNKNEYAKFFVIVLIAIGILIICVDLSHAAEYKKERTFQLKGQKIKVKTDGLDGAEFTKKAKNQLKHYKKVNKKHKVTYKGTISKKQLFKLIDKDYNGESFYVEKKTSKKVIVKKPVYKYYDKVVYKKKVYSNTGQKRVVFNINEKHPVEFESGHGYGRGDNWYWTYKCYDGYKIKMHTFHVDDLHKQYTIITLNKHQRVIKYFKTVRKPVYMMITVNDKQTYGNSGYGSVSFLVNGIGIGCEVAHAKLDTTKKWKFWYG